MLTVSSHGAICSVGAKKFAQRDLSMAIARKYSPCAGKMAQNGRFVACRVNFFAGAGGKGVCWANFVATSGTLIRPRAPPPALRPCPLAPSGVLHTGGALGYRTKRVGFMVTFRLFGAEKSVLKLVGANLKDGLNVLVL